MKLSQLAKVIRSKNAGPLTLSIDVLFDTESDFEAAGAAEELQAPALAVRLRRPQEDIRVITDSRARAIKVVMPRAVVAGGRGDFDVYGSQQHAAFLDIEL